MDYMAELAEIANENGGVIETKAAGTSKPCGGITARGNGYFRAVTFHTVHSSFLLPPFVQC